MRKERKSAQQVIQALNQVGYEAYWVGGCVRDEWLGREPKDYDVATNALPEQVQKVFSHTIPTGLQHGTVTVVIDRNPVEVTTFRVESEYKDHRRPSEVKFVRTLQEDLSRRDFTINAMAKDAEDCLYDYFGGVSDLEAGIIRTVGQPEDRFQEDALRMLRAIRFAAQFQFRLDGSTLKAIQQWKGLCVNLSVERVTAELEKMWEGARPDLGMKLLFDTGLIYDLPPFHRYERWRRLTPLHLTYLGNRKDRIVYWAFLLWMFHTKYNQVEQRCQALKLSRVDRLEIQTCFQLGLGWSSLDEISGKKLLLTYGLEAVQRGWLLAVMTETVDLDSDSITLSRLKQWWSEMPITHLKELDLSGMDLLQAIPKKTGPWIGERLNYLLEQVALRRLENRKDVLLKEGCYLEKRDS
ncbi:CCA tRNA nucleotidyltransferase [Hazenella coriacea]|uniref:tRNA nucleotidyltransferase (CCA-adding enzyme) n=1 Tax=Hazenella coriacea TaxID=1179467 RepID=A0A4R3L5E3_9BACL|nr:CCA tRNA nucleotidyltransferase [Hazenella coriacea]TCS93364.1 tRNA nucleotidyltransferase (CCA-adding enzyme) [Hazenella coriacea]